MDSRKIIMTQMDLEQLLRRILGARLPRDLKDFAERTIYNAQECIDHEECVVRGGI